MDNIEVHLKNGEVITLSNVSLQDTVKNINEFRGNRPTFITFKDYIFVINNIDYIKKAD